MASKIDKAWFESIQDLLTEGSFFHDILRDCTTQASTLIARVERERNMAAEAARTKQAAAQKAAEEATRKKVAYEAAAAQKAAEDKVAKQAAEEEAARKKAADEAAAAKKAAEDEAAKQAAEEEEERKKAAAAKAAAERKAAAAAKQAKEAAAAAAKQAKQAKQAAADKARKEAKNAADAASKASPGFFENLRRRASAAATAKAADAAAKERRKQEAAAKERQKQEAADEERKRKEQNDRLRKKEALEAEEKRAIEEEDKADTEDLPAHIEKVERDKNTFDDKLLRGDPAAKRFAEGYDEFVLKSNQEAERNRPKLKQRVEFCREARVLGKLLIKNLISRSEFEEKIRKLAAADDGLREIKQFKIMIRQCHPDKGALLVKEDAQTKEDRAMIRTMARSHKVLTQIM